MNEPRITVVMPAYNAERFIDDAIRSIRRQTLSDWEMIVVNDGSTDETGCIADRHASEDSRIRVIHQENAGQAAANNHAIPLARAEYIARMDADDFSVYTRLQQLVAALDSNPRLAAVGSNVWICDERGNRVSRTRLPLANADIRRTLFSKQQNCLCNPTLAFRRAAWIKSGGERPCFGHAHDLDLNLRMATVGELRNVDLPLVDYRSHEKQVSVSSAAQQAVCAYASFLAHAFREREGRNPDFASLERMVRFEDLRFAGGSPIRCQEMILAHLSDAHARLCVMGNLADAKGLRRTLHEELPECPPIRLAKAIVAMRIREFRHARTLAGGPTWFGTHRHGRQRNDP